MILRLLDYWQAQGCLIWQPYNVQVGAGTMNPATILRVLGPEPWNVAYIEPSIRPDDGLFHRGDEFGPQRAVLVAEGPNGVFASGCFGVFGHGSPQRARYRGAT